MIGEKYFVDLKLQKLLAMFVVAHGEWNGVQWEYFPNIPNPLANGLYFDECCKNVDFLRLTLNELGRIEVWVIDEKENFYYYSMEEVEKLQPMLYAAIITHVFDMIENVDD